VSIDIKEILETYYAAMEDSTMADAYHERHETESALILTNYDDEHANLVVEYLRERIEGKVVVEIGAGIGLLACHLAYVARKVYAIEVDPAWTSCFLAALYAKKPPNLTFIFGKAEEAPPICADVALFCTHSGHAAMYRSASLFAPVVIDVYAELMMHREEIPTP
jgi:SAM-dependent methyltransferase